MSLEPSIVEAALLHFAEREWGDPYWYMWDQWRDRIKGNTYDVPGLGPVEVVDCNFPKDINYSEHSEDVWIVFKVMGAYYKVAGSHTSYQGTEWEDGMTIVRPVEKIIIEFEDAE